MKRMAGILVLLLLVMGCATVPRPAHILNCEQPEGREYTCYSDKECVEFLKGYSTIFKMRVEDFKETRPIIHMNLFYDHKAMTLIGRIEGEKVEHPTGGKRWYQKMWTIVCDDYGKILNETYSEGFRKTKK